MRLKDKLALITGSSRGIGKVIALAFAREGSDIVVNYHSNEEGARDTCEKIRAMGRRAIMIKADVASKSMVDDMVNEAIRQFGGIHILVNNAGFHGRIRDVDSIQTVTEEEWEKAMSVNVRGIVNCVRAIAPFMIKNKYGKIVNISSIGGMVTSSRTAGISYVVSKGAQNTLTRKLAVELGPYNINVNAIAAGNIIVESQYGTRTKEEFEALSKVRVQKIVLGRLGEPEDVANAAIFFASDESKFTTGQILNVEGGRMDLFSRS